MSNNFFCPAPWSSVYYHKGTTISPCHTNRNLENTATTLPEYVESEWLKNLKADFTKGVVPESCKICFNREALNLKSTRQQFIRQAAAYGASTSFKRIELRTSNLCNFKCRMCDETSSTEIQRENENYPELQEIVSTLKVKADAEEATIVNEVKAFIDSSPDLEVVCLTGGEPMLIKHYQDIMQYLIDKGMNDRVTIDMYANCSVYNPSFLEKLRQFKRIMFTMSIDGVGKTAEYQRHGSIKWDVIESNILRYTSEFTKPRQLAFNTAISPYVLLDVSSLAKFLMRLYEMNNNISTRCYAVITPEAIHFQNMNEDLRKMAYDQIDQAVEILTAENFDILKKELLGIKAQLMNSAPNNPRMFAQYTQALDKVRNESFEETFGYKLY